MFLKNLKNIFIYFFFFFFFYFFLPFFFNNNKIKLKSITKFLFIGFLIENYF
ncbi:hypothetical protein LY90DRAFT_176151 [Neocallimastix californiae]|uniref:Uncharacterized protein n=1 Tax=Neocallimastix californiae TaxID=1754190 RepID=A0A1Y2ER20_9FUNG|nr:hypothetical protein LY90DRAFT_176151 [Neocallimastix californiae]|eukprot:ORY73285.1 hypothetical protein LY90DRAFT_176151 [Neocallimastix californiae]